MPRLPKNAVKVRCDVCGGVNNRIYNEDTASFGICKCGGKYIRAKSINAMKSDMRAKHDLQMFGLQ